MKSLCFVVAGLVFLTGLARPPKGNDVYTLVIAGDVHGYLSPCGCTKPMVGGIKRWATLVKSLAQQGKSVVLVNGGLSGGIGRQQELKVEALSDPQSSIVQCQVPSGHIESSIAFGKRLDFQLLLAANTTGKPPVHQHHRLALLSQ